MLYSEILNLYLRARTVQFRYIETHHYMQFISEIGRQAEDKQYA